MQSLGNDFVVIDGTTQSFQPTSTTIQAIANRHTGIGCDQVLLLEPKSHTHADFNYRIFNADGNEVGQCGNGARCMGRFIHERGLSQKKTLTLATISTTLHITVHDLNHVSVTLPPPCFNPSGIPMITMENGPSHTLTLANGQSIEFIALSVGNPHAVLLTETLGDAPVAEIGTLLNQAPEFSSGVNVGFMHVLSPHNVQLRTFERGVGETLACGSGACAGVVAGVVLGLLRGEVTVNLRGGELTINWPGEGQPVTMTGSASHVFTGYYIGQSAPSTL